MAKASKKFTLRAAVYLILKEDSRILLARRYKTGYEDGKYSLAAGHLDGDETLKQAMIREAKEELDIALQEHELELVHTSHRRSNGLEYIDFYFVAMGWQGDPRIGEPDKCDDLKWYSLDKLPSSTLAYVHQVLTHIEHGVTFSEIGFETNLESRTTSRL